MSGSVQCFKKYSRVRFAAGMAMTYSYVTVPAGSVLARLDRCGGTPELLAVGIAFTDAPLDPPWK